MIRGVIRNERPRADGQVDAPRLVCPSLRAVRQIQASLKGHAQCVLWFTGLSGAGKSTIAGEVQRILMDRGNHTALLDGDIIREGLCRDLTFIDRDRTENVRRVAEVARLMADAGLIVIVSMISPLQAHRTLARDIVGADFVEVFVDTPLEVAESRDPKGLYRRARRGEIANFTGIDSPYEPPERPELHLRTLSLSPFASAAGVLAYLQQLRIIPEDTLSSSVPAENRSTNVVSVL